MKLKYWNETLENIIKDPRNDKFKLIVNKIEYNVPLSYALGISPLITEQYLKDPTNKEFNIIINTNENNQIKEQDIREEFDKFVKGQEISDAIFYEIGIQLKNKEMIKNWTINQKYTKETIIKIIRANHTLFYDKNQDIEAIKKVLEYIGENIEKMKEEIKELNEEEIIFILKNDKIKVEKEDIIWEIVKERIKSTYNRQDTKDKEDKKNKQNKSLLLGTIEGKYLSKDYFKEYIEMIEEEDIEREMKIFKNIKEILLNNIDNLELEGKERNNNNLSKAQTMIIEHKEGNNFDGIIKFLENKYGTNICQQGIISISVSHPGYPNPELVIDYNSNQNWQSENHLGEWLEINFKEQKMKITGYSLMTYSSSANCHHLKNWVIEGSQDRNQWIEFDKKENNQDLNGSNYHHYYPLSKSINQFQYIRIRTIGLNHMNYYYLMLTNIEFYGELLTNS